MSDLDADLAYAIETVAHAHGVVLSGPHEITTWECGNCGCKFLPMLAEGELYPDRYAHVGQNGTGCGSRCNCHQLPYTAIVPPATDPT